MKQITLFFTIQVLGRKSGVYILKVPQGDDEWNELQTEERQGENSKK